MKSTASRRRFHIAADDQAQTGAAGLLLSGELVRSLGLVNRLDEAVLGFKRRRRGDGAGTVLVALAEMMIAGGSHLAHLDEIRLDGAGRDLRAVAEPPSRTTAGQLLGRFGEEQADDALLTIARAGLIHDERLGLSARRAISLDIDTTTVEVYGSRKEGAVYNYKGQRSYQPRTITWGERKRALAADLLNGSAAGAPGSGDLLEAALAGLPRRHGPVALRGDTAFSCGELMGRCRARGVRFALCTQRSRAMWRMLSEVPAQAWKRAIGMPQAEVAETTYTPEGWGHEPLRLLIRRVPITREELGSSERARRRATIPADQLALLLEGDVDQTYGYSFILTDKPGKAVVVEQWQRHRTDIEERFDDTKLGCGLRHLPCGTLAANRGWMVAALLASNLMAMLSATVMATSPQNATPAESGAREPRFRKTATLRRWLIAIPGRVAHSGRQWRLYLPAGTWWAPEFRRTYDWLYLAAGT